MTHKKIPETLYDEIYQLYLIKTPVVEIKNKLLVQYKIDASEKTIYTAISKIRAARKIRLHEALQQSAADDVKLLDFIQKELISLLEDCRYTEKLLYLKIIDRILRCVEIKYVGKRNAEPVKSDMTEQIKAEWISQLQGVSITPSQPKKD